MATAGQSNSSKKQQKTISSFFAPKATTSNVVIHPLRDGDVNITTSSSASKPAPGESSENDDDDNDLYTPPPKKRSLPPSDDDPRKRQKSDANAPSKQTTSDRTSKYMLNSADPLEPATQEMLDSRARMHQRFVKKLGRVELRPANADLEEGMAAEDDDEPEPEPEPISRRPLKKGQKTGNLTPLEKQVLEIKAKHPDTMLVVEVGYKFRFFGEDARHAAGVLSIVCIPGKMRYDEHASEAHLTRFASASIPVHRLHVHVKRLVAAGHKVGVVRQLETAALKAVGDNRNAPFTRKLTNLYTKGTYIDDIEELEEPSAAPNTGYLLGISETELPGEGKVRFGIVAVQPATGDVIYDDFEDGFMRSEIETRLLHISPCEFLIVGDLTPTTEKLVKHLSGSSANVFGDRIRVERVEKKKTSVAESYSHVSSFYADKMKDSPGSNAESARLLDKVLKLSELTTVCLSALIKHLTDFGLEHVFDLTKYFQSFSARSHMLLNGNTLSSLEIYKNQADNSERGSLFWTMNRTQTRSGQRLLRKWVGRPLLDKQRLQERINAVEELRGDRSGLPDQMRGILQRTKIDLEKGLLRIYYGKCTRKELISVLQALHRAASAFAGMERLSTFKSDLLKSAIVSVPKIETDVVAYLEKINARSEDKYDFFRPEAETEDMVDFAVSITAVEHDLKEFQRTATEKLGLKKKVEYVTVAGIDYLIELPNTNLKHVPASWVKVSGTKAMSRFHPPEVIKMLRERDQLKESLAAACEKAYSEFLAEIAEKYQTLRDVVSSLATIDCLLSLEEISNRPGYTQPVFVDTAQIEIRGGRHPTVELLAASYVPNDAHLTPDNRALLITGPNMGGKSSYVRQIALICIMAQIGSYVPADSAELGVLDAVLTRMGAEDSIFTGESTFMVEVSETSDILKLATPRSLVLLDELGRGTSTHDGLAIANAVLHQLVTENQSLTCFITHYQSLSRLASSPAFASGLLRNVHMSFSQEVDDDGDGEEKVTFLYELADGTSLRSYGLNVAKLAGIPKSVLLDAEVKSRELEAVMRARRLTACLGKAGKGEWEVVADVIEEI